MRAARPDGTGSRFGMTLVRRLWIALALTLVVAAGAVALYVRPSAPWRHAYVSMQALRVVAGTGSAASTYDTYLAHQEAVGFARDIASGAVLSSAPFDVAVATTLATHHAALVTSFGAGVPSSVSVSDVAAALSATDSGDVVTLSSRWDSAAGANALLGAAVVVLTSADDLRTLLPPADVAPTPDSALVLLAGALVLAQLDASVADAARQELLARIELGALFGLAIAVLLAGLSLRSIQGHTLEAASTPDARDSYQASYHPSSNSSRSQ